jgi:hypothetical protein
MNAISIKGNGGTVSIHIAGYSSADATDSHDANWLSAEIEIAAGCFTGRYPANLTTQDFVRFQESLGNMLETLNGKALFSTMEGWLRLEIDMTRRGSAMVSGEAIAEQAPKVALRFSFESDQSYLQETLTAVRSAVQNFPVRAQASPA